MRVSEIYELPPHRLTAGVFARGEATEKILNSSSLHDSDPSDRNDNEPDICFHMVTKGKTTT